MKAKKPDNTGGRVKTLGRTVTFQPSPEVRALIEQARSAGLDITSIINSAISEKGPGVAADMAQDARKRLDSFLKGKA
jgi:hypothetical protein